MARLGVGKVGNGTPFPPDAFGMPSPVTVFVTPGLTICGGNAKRERKPDERKMGREGGVPCDERKGVTERRHGNCEAHMESMKVK
eukprot:6204930-Pleurochrysis_carterae.AAC.1